VYPRIASSRKGGKVKIAEIHTGRESHSSEVSSDTSLQSLRLVNYYDDCLRRKIDLGGTPGLRWEEEEGKRPLIFSSVGNLCVQSGRSRSEQLESLDEKDGRRAREGTRSVPRSAQDLKGKGRRAPEKKNGVDQCRIRNKHLIHRRNDLAEELHLRQDPQHRKVSPAP